MWDLNFDLTEKLHATFGVLRQTFLAVKTFQRIE